MDCYCDQLKLYGCPDSNLFSRYVVPMDVLEPFETEWRFREVNMQKVDGFLGLEVERLDGQYVVESTWKSIPAWEKWSCCDVARRSHLPVVKHNTCLE